MLRLLLFASCLSAPFLAATEVCAQRSSSDLGDALTQPLRDLSILRRETPEALQQAAVSPYADGPTLPTGALDCASISREIDSLDVALGEEVLGSTQMGLMAQAQNAAGNAIVDAIGDLVELPYRGVIRRVSGAERRDREMRDAEQAGTVRRAFLRGLTARECSVPELLAAFDPTPAPPPSDLELARMQLAAASEAAGLRDSTSLAAPAAGVDGAMTDARPSDLALAQMQLAAANEAANATAQVLTPPIEPARGAASAAAPLSDLELARNQLAAAHAAAASAQ